MSLTWDKASAARTNEGLVENLIMSLVFSSFCLFYEVMGISRAGSKLSVVCVCYLPSGAITFRFRSKAARISIFASLWLCFF